MEGSERRKWLVFESDKLIYWTGSWEVKTSMETCRISTRQQTIGPSGTRGAKAFGEKGFPILRVGKTGRLRVSAESELHSVEEKKPPPSSPEKGNCRKDLLPYCY